MLLLRWPRPDWKRETTPYRALTHVTIWIKTYRYYERDSREAIKRCLFRLRIALKAFFCDQIELNNGRKRGMNMANLLLF